MAYYSNLLSKCDRALSAYLIAQGAGTTSDVFPAKKATDLPNPPFTVCYAESAMEAQEFSGTYTVKASIEVHTNAAPEYNQDTDQMVLDSDERVAKTFDEFHRYKDDNSGAAMADLVTAAGRAAGGDMADFTCLNLRVVKIEQGRGEKDAEWIDTIDIEFIACGKNVSP